MGKFRRIRGGRFGGKKGKLDKREKGLKWDILQGYKGKIKVFWSTIFVIREA